MNDSIINIDCNDLEQRVSNSLTGDGSFNVDPYKEMASEMFNVPYDEVTDDQRLEAKRKHYFNRYTSGWKI